VKRTPLTRKTPMKRTAIKRSKVSAQQVANRRSNRLDFTEDVKRAAAIKAGHRCHAQLHGCRQSIQHHHHRRLRSHGGPGTVENCLALCGPCHNVIHANPEWAYNHGFLVRAYNDESAVPVADCRLIGCESNHCGQ
jgi:hypothetical protein